jgi:hypothetical protein
MMALNFPTINLSECPVSGEDLSSWDQALHSQSDPYGLAISSRPNATPLGLAPSVPSCYLTQLRLEAVKKLQSQLEREQAKENAELDERVQAFNSRLPPNRIRTQGYWNNPNMQQRDAKLHERLTLRGQVLESLAKERHSLAGLLWLDAFATVQGGRACVPPVSI